MRIRNPLRSAIRLLFFRAPVEAQLIVTRRCNLSCGYCTEYDNFSPPIPLEILQQRIDALHRLRVINIALLGGEPLLHPHIGDIVRHARRKAQVSITTNGFLLSRKKIEALNEAGLDNLQVSIDTLYPDPDLYIQKSMKTLAQKLERLRQLAAFDVHLNIVLCEASREEFREMVREVARMGFVVTVNLVHNERGMVEISGEEYLELWEYHFRHSRVGSLMEYEYGRQLLRGKFPRWKCRAGSRFLYVDEFGKVQFCSAQRGRLDRPVLEYSRKDLKQHSHTYKGCEAGCSLFCVYRNSMVDNAPLQALKSVVALWRRGVMDRATPSRELQIQEEIEETV